MTSPARRFDKFAVFDDLGHRPHPGQVLVHRSKALRRVLASGARSGKSTCAAWETIAGLLAPRPSTLAWLVAPTFELTTRVWQPVVAVFQERLAYRVLEFRPREHRLVISNLAGGRSELRAKSADQPSGLLGEALDFVVVDEATQLRGDIWPSFIMPRLIDRRGWSLIISTPHGTDWFYEEFRHGQRGRDLDCESWAMPSWTNPHVSADVIESERRRLPEDTFNEQFGAQFIGAPADPCDLCGGPTEKAIGKITMRRSAELARCPGCKMPIGADGQCMVRVVCDGIAELWIDHEPEPGEDQESGEDWMWKHPTGVRRTWLTLERHAGQGLQSRSIARSLRVAPG